MTNSSAYNTYKQTAVETASPEKLIVMLYDGAIKFTNQAQAAMREGKIEEANRALLKTQDIINELMGSLNFDTGEIARNLYNLYDYFRQRLIQANLKKDTEALDEIIDFLTEMRDTWVEAGIKAKAASKKVANGLNVEV